MAQKCALIVDDSTTARQMLGRVLETYELRVDMAESAEQALEYLRQQRPDVIFMDHLMPGMDGLQAVRAIKTNPATATIPIMMYTSQEGELYVGQARALGALGVMPKQIKPVEVSRVLKSLHLYASEDHAPSARSAPSPTQALPGPRDAPDQWMALRPWLEQILTEHGQALKEDLHNDIETSVARLLRERAPPATVAPLPAASVQPHEPRRPRRASLPVIVGLLAVAAGLFYLNLVTQRKWREAVAHNASLMAALSNRRASASEQALTAAQEIDATRARLSTRFPELLNALEWSLNQSATYPADEIPLGDERLTWLTGLMERLQSLGFVGTVRLESHVGDFCYVSGARSGTEGGPELMVAPDDLPANRCERFGHSAEESKALSARQSVAFADYVGAQNNTGPIRVEFDPEGNAHPVIAYPQVLEGVSAGEWNRIARRNNRVLVRLLPAVVASNP